MAEVIYPDEILQKRRMGKTAAACLFVVDANGSMRVEERMEAANGAVFTIPEESYKNRDKVGMIAFRGEEADLILPLSPSIDLTYIRLTALPTGGKTPFAAGLEKSFLNTVLNPLNILKRLKESLWPSLPLPWGLLLRLSNF